MSARIGSCGISLLHLSLVVHVQHHARATVLHVRLLFTAPTVIEEPGDDEVKQKDGLLRTALQYTKRRVRATCTMKTLYKRLPILSWLPRYNGQDALGDLVAGITVGLTVIPQSLAYSNVAGLPPQVSEEIFIARSTTHEESRGGLHQACVAPVAVDSF